MVFEGIVQRLALADLNLQLQREKQRLQQLRDIAARTAIEQRAKIEGFAREQCCADQADAAQDLILQAQARVREQEAKVETLQNRLDTLQNESGIVSPSGGTEPNIKPQTPSRQTQPQQGLSTLQKALIAGGIGLLILG